MFKTRPRGWIPRPAKRDSRSLRRLAWRPGAATTALRGSAAGREPVRCVPRRASACRSTSPGRPAQPSCQHARASLRLDPFDAHRHDSALASVGHRADDRHAFLVADVADEAAVDLDHVERQRAQVRQRRIAGAEIVEREADALVLEAGDDRSREVDVGEQRAFGDLDHQPLGREAGLGQQRTIRCASQLSVSCEGEMLTDILIDGSQCAASASAAPMTCSDRRRSGRSPRRRDEAVRGPMIPLSG
jgi:hypothetical protein